MRSSISRNFVFLFTSEALSHLLGFAATAYIARMVGVEGFGKIHYGLAFLTYGLLLNNLGLTTIGAREITKDHANPRIVEEIFGLRILIALFLFMIFSVALFMMPGDLIKKNIISIYMLVLFPYALHAEFVFQGREEMEYVGLSRLLQYGTYTLLLFLFLRYNSSILLVPWFYLASYFISVGFLLFMFWNRYHSLKLSFSITAYRGLLIAAVPVGAATLFYQVAVNLAPVVLGIFHGDAAVGNFSAGFKIVFLLLIIERVFYFLFFPVFSRIHARTPEVLPSVFSFFTKIILYLVIPLAGAGIMLAPRIIQLVYGPGYGNAVMALRILLLYFLAAPLNTVWGYGLIAIGQERRFFKVLGITAAAGSCMILVLGILYGTSGACFGLLAGEICGLVLMRMEIRKVLKFAFIEGIARPAAATFIMLIIVWLLMKLPLLVLVLTGAAVYFTAVYLFKGFTIDELSKMRSAIRG